MLIDKLPEKWQVKGTKCKTVQQFFLTYKNNNINDFVSHPSYEDWWFFSDANTDKEYLSFADYKQNSNYTEISFEDFERLVLNINKELEYEIC